MKIGHEVVRMLMDAGIVSDYCDEYGEPGYSVRDEDGFVIFGNYWCSDRNCNYEETYEDGKKKIHSVEFHYPRLFAAMEKQGIEFEWEDEWVVDSNASKAYRTTADSYQWQSSILWGDGDFLTPDDAIEDWIEQVVNDPHRCLPKHIWLDSDLNEQGFTEYQCGYENGWFPGQTDNPEEISRIITNEYEEQGKEVDILYKLSYVSQFDLGFCVFVREVKENEDGNH